MKCRLTKLEILTETFKIPKICCYLHMVAMAKLGYTVFRTKRHRNNINVCAMFHKAIMNIAGSILSLTDKHT